MGTVEQEGKIKEQHPHPKYQKFSSIYVIHFRFMILNNKLLIAIFILILIFIIYSSYS